MFELPREKSKQEIKSLLEGLSETERKNKSLGVQIWITICLFGMLGLLLWKT